MVQNVGFFPSRSECFGGVWESIDGLEVEEDLKYSRLNRSLPKYKAFVLADDVNVQSDCDPRWASSAKYASLTT